MRPPARSSSNTTSGPGERSALRPRPRPDRRRGHRRRGLPPLARPGAARRALGLHALLAGRAPQHAGHRQRGDGGADRARRRRHVAHPRRRRRHHAAQPRAVAGGRAVRHAGVAVSRPHRSRAGPRAGHRPGGGDGAAAHAATRSRRLSRRRRRADGVPARPAQPGSGCGRCPAPGSTCRSGSSARARSARRSPRRSACRSRSPRTSRRRCSFDALQLYRERFTPSAAAGRGRT